MLRALLPRLPRLPRFPRRSLAAAASVRPTAARPRAAGGRRVEQLPVPEVVKQNLLGMGVSKLFEIQYKAFEPILRGKSFVGRSQTGTGKTVAYLLPLLERMRNEKMSAAHSLLILVPTRELCKQVGSSILSLSVHADVALVYGGPSLDSQEQLVRLGATIVVATPGRCARLIERGALQTQNVRALVVDEADAMFGPEFVGRVERVLNGAAKPGLQQVLFSASLPSDVLSLIQRFFPTHEFVDLVDRHGTPGDAVVKSVDHRLCKVPERSSAARARVLLHVLNEQLNLSGGRCIIFVDTTSEARSLLAHPALDRRARAVHGDSSAQERDGTLSSFANQEFDVLIATDIVSRGIDFADVSLVLQLHPPKEPTQYVHRSGRTGRAGNSGTCVTFYNASEQKFVQRVRDFTKHDFAMLPVPGPMDIHHAAVSRLLEQLLSVQPEEYEQVMDEATRLLEERGPVVLATAMAVLDSRHADLQRSLKDRVSLLSGRKGYLCLLANDPEHRVATTEGEAMRLVGSILPKPAVVGRVARVSGGWALDVEHHYAGKLVEDLRRGKVSAPFEVSVASRLPRLLRMASRRARQMAKARLGAPSVAGPLGAGAPPECRQSGEEKSSGRRWKAGFEFLGPSAVVHGKEPWFELQVRDLQRAAQAEPLVQCDAFADCPGAGNQAAVVFSQRNGDETWMQKVAAENNLSETAFVELLSPGEADGPCRFSLRWFTPTTEVDLCGHATLATAHALWSTNRAAKKRRIDFETKASGVLTCKLCDGWIEMDFPEDPPAMGPAAAKTSAAVLAKALGAQEADVLALGRGKFDVLCELRPEAFEALKPNQALLAEVECRGVAVTTAGSGKDAERAGGPGTGKKLSIDFRSRFFAPRAGLPEDPVTGSAHCMLAPYWAKRLGRADGEVVGFQASARGGVVKCRLAAGRVALAGPATTTLEGMLYCG
ncbi:unnamed protein product [Effrenium voratum]|nr:unnamed protein product [Effrenium voratum]